MLKNMMTQDRAELLALRAVEHLMMEDTRRDRFLALTGLDEAALKETIACREGLAGLLDFYVGFEPDLLSLADYLCLPADDITAAWEVLAGTQRHWT